MTTTLTMPEVGETVTEGTIERWLKKPGDHVDKYEPIVEVNTETDFTAKNDGFVAMY